MHGFFDPIRATASTLGLLLCLGAMPAAAQFVEPDPITDGWSRFDPKSSYAEWDFFFFTSGGNPPDVGLFPSPLPAGWVQPDVRETTGNAFLTSTGNMYSFDAILEFEATMPGEEVAGVGAVVLVQTRTLGRELNPDTMTLNGHAPVLITELFRLDTPDIIFGGSTVDTLWRFELPASAEVYIWVAEALDTSMSLDRIAIDTFPIDSDDCPFDLNGDQIVDGLDVLLFLDLLEAKDPRADFDQSGVVDVFDLFMFLNGVGPC
jgi:hypothetical protein